MAATAVMVATTGVGYAATGGNWILGQANSATSRTSLSAPIAGKALQVTNTNTDPAAGGIAISVAAGRPPIVVSSGAGKATNLDADKLDGLDSAAFLRKGQPNGASASTSLSAPIAGKALQVNNTSGDAAAAGIGVTVGAGRPPIVVSPGAGKATNLDADKLDGLDSSAFLPAGGKAADAESVDGLDSSQLVVGGGRVIKGRVVNAGPGTLFLNVPFLGQLRVNSCNAGVDATIIFDTVGTGNADFFVFPHAGGAVAGIGGTYTSEAQLLSARTIVVTRDVNPNAIVTTIWVGWDANGCRFAAQAIQSPAL